MKNLFLLICLIICCDAFAQAPQAFNYQGIARDANGIPIINTNISLRITLKEGGTPGLEVYKETHFVQTNKLGLFSLEVGRGSSPVGIFQNIQWGSGNHFIQIEIDPTGGQNFIPMGTAQLLSVPYALYAASGNSQWQDNPQGIHYNSGNVGIGTANPQNRLSLAGHFDNGDERWLLSLDNFSTSNRSYSSMKLTAGSGGSQTDLTQHATSYDYDGNTYTDFGQLRSNGSGLILRSDANNSVIKFLVGNEGGLTFPERMRITADGKVGIGTATPESNLSIVDSDNIGSEADYISVKNTSLGNRSGVTISLSAGDNNSTTTLGHHAETYDFDGDKYTDFGQLRSTGKGIILRTESVDGVIKFLTGFTPTASPPERMRIAANGNIGIGTVNPVSKLQVTNGDVFIENINNGVIMKSPNGNCWRVTVQNDGTLKTTAITCPN